MDGESATCLVCHSSKKQLICPLCASNAINTDISSFRELRGATHRRLGLERQLQASLDRQVLTSCTLEALYGDKHL